MLGLNENKQIVVDVVFDSAIKKKNHVWVGKNKIFYDRAILSFYISDHAGNIGLNEINKLL